MSYKYLDHTADVKFEATGATLQEAFGEAAKAFTGVITDEKVKQSYSMSLSVVAESYEALLFDFLGHLVLLLDTDNFLTARASINIMKTGKNWLLSGILYGDEAKHYAHSGDVKAPTYHDLVVEEKNGRWRVVATLDI